MLCVPDKRPALRRAVLIGCSTAALIATMALRALPPRVASRARPAQAADRFAAYVPVVSETRAPIGWIDFCPQTPRDCAGGPTQARDVVLTSKAWRDLVQVNTWVNDAIKPMTDL